MIYIQHTGKKITGYSEIQHFDNDLLIDPSLIDLSKISYYEVINGKLIYNANLLNDQLKKEEVFFRIVELRKLLQDTDYKIIKCYEASLLGLSAPYDIVSLAAQRNLWRAEINQLENTL